MKMDCLRRDDWTVMVLKGDVDSFTYPIWAKELDVLMRTGVKKLRLDLTLGSIFNLKSMQNVVSILAEIQKRNGELEVVGVNDETKEMIELMVKANSQLKTAPLKFKKQE